jgi:hypothetical protein
MVAEEFTANYWVFGISYILGLTKIPKEVLYAAGNKSKKKRR